MQKNVQILTLEESRSLPVPKGLLCLFFSCINLFCIMMRPLNKNIKITTFIFLIIVCFVYCSYRSLCVVYYHLLQRKAGITALLCYFVGLLAKYLIKVGGF